MFSRLFRRRSRSAALLDASRSGILDVIVESTATKIFLPNLFARDEDS